MADKNAELKYYERLNIPIMTIGGIKELVKENIKNTITCWESGIEAEKQTFHVIGPAGVGKTQICYQICEELTSELFPNGDKTFECLVIKCPVLSRDDFIIPFPIIDNGNSSYKMLYSNFVPKIEDSYGLLVIDEFSRGDHSLQQLMWQIQNECMIHLKKMPKGWFVISVDNPDDQEYTMDYLEDAAGLRRMLHIYTDVNVPDFIAHAKKAGFHPSIIEFIQTHPNYLYDFQAQKVGSVYANPASYERVSNILWGYEKTTGIKNNLNSIETLVSGLLNTSKSRLFMDFLRDMKDISPLDVFHNYEKVREDIEKVVKEENNAKLGELISGFLTYLSTDLPEYGKAEKANTVELLTTVPIDTAALFITQIDTFDRSGAAFKYITKLHYAMLKEYPKYKTQFYDKAVKLGRGGR